MVTRDSYRTDSGLIVGKLIEAISGYFYRRKFSRAVIMVLLKAGIGILSIGFVAQLVIFLFLGATFEPTSVAVGFVLIAIALVLLALERNWAKSDLPDIDFEPDRSFFAPLRMDNDRGDAKYIKGRSFSIKVYFRVKAGRKAVKLLRAQAFAFDRGIGCLNLVPNYYIGERRIISAWEENANFREPIAASVSIAGSYYFDPPVEIPKDGILNFAIDRQFGPPFKEKGAPFDFKDSEIKLLVDYVVDGKSKSDEFFYQTHYYTNGLKRIPSISDVPYFSDRQINFYYSKGCITLDERDKLLAVNPETRIRAMESRWKTPEDIRTQHGVDRITYQLMLKLRRESNRLPSFDPDAVWRTRHGRLAKWIIDRINAGQP